MSVILSVFFNPDFWVGLVSNALGAAFGAPFGTAVGDFLHETLRVGTGLVGGFGGNGGDAGLFGAFLR